MTAFLTKFVTLSPKFVEIECYLFKYSLFSVLFYR